MLKLRSKPIENQKEQNTQKSFYDIKGEVLNSALEISDEMQISLAQKVCITVLRSYWMSVQHQISGELEFPEFPRNLNVQIKASVEDSLIEFGKTLTALSMEEAAYEASHIYTMMLPPSQRSKFGVFYTPPILAKRLVRKAQATGIDWKSGRVIDPACGAGALLIPVALKMINSLAHSDPEIVIRNLRTRLEGWEIDPFSAWLTKFFIEVAAAPLTQGAGELVNANVRVMDSLYSDPKEFGRFDLVIGNPPFGRQKLGDELRGRYSRSLFGHANLYGIFTELAVNLAKKGGVVAYLTPPSFLGGEYFKNLRSLLWEKSPPISLDFVESRKGVFGGVLQETVLATYRKGSLRKSASVYAINLDEQGLDVSPAGRFKLPAQSSAPWMVARSATEKKFASKVRTLPSRLSDWGYKVSTGPLVWNRYKSQLSTRKSKNSIPIVWAESVTSMGEFHLRSEKRNHKPFLKISSSKDNWLKVTRECVLLQRTTSKEQERRLIAAPMPKAVIDKCGGVSVENHLNMIYSVESNPMVSIEVLAAFLNSKAADRAFRCISGSVSVSAYELESLPLPSCNSLEKLSRMVFRKVARDLIENECRVLFEGDR